MKKGKTGEKKGFSLEEKSGDCKFTCGHVNFKIHIEYQRGHIKKANIKKSPVWIYKFESHQHINGYLI